MNQHKINFNILWSVIFIFAIATESALCSKTLPTTSSFKIVFLGDSLTDGYGLDKDRAYPRLVEKLFHENGYKNVSTINAGISGSTSSSGPQRLRWLLKSKPDVVAIALGANDGLRGVPVSELKKNLESMIEMAKKENAFVVLFGMQMPPNYGADYRKQFSQVFVDLAQKHKVPRLEFLLEGVATKPELNLEDQIHPNARGHELMAKNVYRFLENELKKNKLIKAL